MAKISKLNQEQIDKKIAELLSVVDMNYVFTKTTQGILFIGGERPTDIQLANLKAEADFFVNSTLWKLLYETPKELAQKAMFVSGETLADMQKGRSMLYLLDSQKKIIDTLRSYQHK